MILTDYFESAPSLQWRLAKQMGVNHAVWRLPDDPDFDVTDFSAWQAIYAQFQAYGIKPVVLEPVPNCIHNHIKSGDEQRDICIERFLKMLPIMDRLDVRTICANFMAKVGWYRTSSVIEERGGARVTGFDIDQMNIDPALEINEEKLWENLTCFLQAAVPAAEKYGIRLALHPDDPPIPKLRNVSHILTSKDALQRAINLVPSDNVGIALCQGCYCAMGEDLESVIRTFGKQQKIFFVHFRDVAGQKEHFHETFHDNGPTDMPVIIRLYQQMGYRGPIRVDHVPTMAGEENQKPGYELSGRLFAVGYLKGILDAVGYDYI